MTVGIELLSVPLPLSELGGVLEVTESEYLQVLLGVQPKQVLYSPLETLNKERFIVPVPYHLL